MRSDEIIEFNGRKYKVLYNEELNQYVLKEYIEESDKEEADGDEPFEELKDKFNKAFTNDKTDSVSGKGIDTTFSNRKPTVKERIKEWFKTPTDDERYGKINRDNTIEALHDRIDRLEKILKHVMEVVRIHGN